MSLVNCKLRNDTRYLLGRCKEKCLIINCTSCWGHLLWLTMLMSYKLYGQQLQPWEGCHEPQPYGNTGCTNEEVCVSFSSQKRSHDTQHCSTLLNIPYTWWQEITTKSHWLCLKHPWKFCWARWFLVCAFTLSSIESTLRDPKYSPTHSYRSFFTFVLPDLQSICWKRKQFGLHAWFLIESLVLPEVQDLWASCAKITLYERCWPDSLNLKFAISGYMWSFSNHEVHQATCSPSMTNFM